MSELSLYATGKTASYFGASASMCEAVIDGVRWHTRPDMIISAMDLLKLQEAYPGRITLVGKTLPNALRGKPRAFMELMPAISATGAVSNLRTTREAA
jgi:hypothetical protein